MTDLISLYAKTLAGLARQESTDSKRGTSEALTGDKPQPLAQKPVQR